MKRALVWVGKKLLQSGLWILNSVSGQNTGFTIIHRNGKTQYHWWQEPK